MPSERSFGRQFALLFLVAGGYLWSQAAMPWAIACLAASVVVGTIAQVAPRVLRPLNRAWFAFGLLLSRLVSPIVLGVMFFLLITPVAVFGRLFGRDELRLKVRRSAGPSYWIKRVPPGPPGESFRRPF